MHIAPYANLTIFHIHHANASHHPLDGLGPKSVLALPMSIPVEQVARVDRVEAASCPSESAMPSTSHAGPSSASVGSAQGVLDCSAIAVPESDHDGNNTQPGNWLDVYA